MFGRRVLGGAMVVLGIASSVVGLVGLLGEDGGVAAVERSPTVTEEPTPTATESPTAEPTVEPTVEPTAEPTPESTAETPEVFFAAMGEAFSAGDARFLFSRLHPFVLDRYGAPQCRASLGDTEVPDYAVEVLEVEEDRGVFVYDADGLRRRVHGATTVRIRFTEDGETFIETDTHIVLTGDRFQWLTDCGTPIAGAA